MSATALDYYPSQFASRSLPATATAPRPSLPVSRGATLNYPERFKSLPAGGRSLMVGCALRRQTRAQGGACNADRYREIRPTRRFIPCWTGDLNAIANVSRLNVAGPDTRLTAHVLAKQCGHQPAVQAFADVPPSHFLEPFRVPVLVSHDANENGFTDAETPFAPGAKDHD